MSIVPVEKAEEFLRFVWSNRLYTSLSPETIRIVGHGTENFDSGAELVNVQYERDGKSFCGPAAVHHHASDWRKHLHHIDPKYDDCVLNIVFDDDAVICRTDGSVVPALTLTCPEELVDRYNRLIEGSRSYRCGKILGELPEVKRHALLTWLTIERLERKYNDFVQRYRLGGNNWNEAFYITLFRTLGAGSNREPYEKLAQTVSYVQICRIKESLPAVEALLLGGAGLLDAEYPDDYTYRLQQEFRHLQRRFDILPMRRNEWETMRHHPNHTPIIRIVELAALLASKDFLFSRLIECKSYEEVRKILDIQTSEYWATHYRPSQSSRYSVKGFGHMMICNMCINLVAPMIFTYGKISKNEEMKERAIDLLEQIPAENNTYIRNWQYKGITAENAFFTQGLLQLSKEYCEKKRCTECNIGKSVMCSR